VNIAVKVRKRPLNDGDVKGTWLQNRGAQRGHPPKKGDSRGTYSDFLCYHGFARLCLA